MALTPGFAATGTWPQTTPGAPTVIKGTYTAGTSAVMNTVAGMPARTDYTIIPFTPVGTFTTQGGSLANPSTNALGANDYFFVDGSGVLYLCTQLASVVSSYANGTQYTLNLIPQTL
jgi:hypothetical protein